MGDYSTILFARPTFIDGVARLVDFGNTLNEYNNSLTPEQADYNALRCDWYAVGDDMKKAIEQFRQEYRDQLPDAQQE